MPTPRTRSTPVSTVRLGEVYRDGMAGKQLVQFIDVRHPDHEEVCRLLTTKFANSGGTRALLPLALDVVAPLITLLESTSAARRPLATAGRVLWSAAAYPEARACLEAVLPFASALPLDPAWNVPWRYSGERAFVEGPREEALLRLYYAECLLAAGQHEDGERAFIEAFALAEKASLPTYLQLAGATDVWGDLSDFRVHALTRAARAIRLCLAGRDACVWRKLPKSKQVPLDDPKLLATATAYEETAHSIVDARAPEQ